jgi:hypothetical protein
MKVLYVDSTNVVTPHRPEVVPAPQTSIKPMNDITIENVHNVLKNYISEDKEYTYYDEGMYIKRANKKDLINLILRDIFQPKKDVQSGCHQMDCDMSGLGPNGCSCHFK